MRILITGVHSYVGNSFAHWCSLRSEAYSISFVSLKSDTWKTQSLAEYDVILHVAGIAHVSARQKMNSLYQQVNCDLSIELATKAKNEGVKQFIFMSSMLVYGDSGHIHERKMIDRDTIPQPTNRYGHSKLDAEQGIFALQDERFQVVAIRAPFIYGKGCKGNYQKLSLMARILPFFPEIENERSMIHIDHMSEFIRLMIKHQESGVFFPQNQEYVQSTQLVQLIADVHGKHVKTTKMFNTIIGLVARKVGFLNKLFGNLTYDQQCSEYSQPYCVHDLLTTVRLTENT